MPGWMFLFFVIPGLLLLIFVVIQFYFRGTAELNAAMWRKEGRCTRCGHDLQGKVGGVCPGCREE